MGDSEARCPACGPELKTANLAGVNVRICPQCRGTLIAQIDMIRTLEAMSAEMHRMAKPARTLNRMMPFP